MSRWDDLGFSLDQLFKGKTKSDIKSFVIDPVLNAKPIS